MATKYYIDKTFTDENGQPDGCTLSTIDKGDFAQIVSMYKRHVQRCANGATWTKVEKKRHGDYAARHAQAVHAVQNKNLP